MALRPRLATGLPLLRYKVPATRQISGSRRRHFRKPNDISSNRSLKGKEAQRLTARASPGTSIGYLINSKILNIGMYRAMTIAPTMPPRKAIMIGSISDTRDSVIDSTSWS
ncbi:hypothetical protein BH20ACT23_BH20ACT23_06700 [soil metagenome]